MEKTVIDLLSRSNPVFSNYVIFSSILVIKMMLMGPFTGFWRTQTQVRHSFIIYLLNLEIKLKKKSYFFDFFLPIMFTN